MIVEVLVFLLTLLVLVLRDRKPKLMPPGPSEIPFIGQAPNVTREYLEDLREKYGDIVTVRTGALRTVLVFSYRGARDLLGRPETAFRPAYLRDFMVDSRREGGVAMSNGAQWAHDRRFMLRNLRNFGMGKTYLEDAINVEAHALVDHILSFKGEPLKIPDAIRTSALNVIWQMMASRRFDLNDEGMKKNYEAWEKFLRTAGTGFMLTAWFPVIKYLPEFLKNKLFQMDAAHYFKEGLIRIIDESIEEHERNFNPNNLNDLIDEYLHEMKIAEETGNEHLFRKGALAQIVADGFDAGSNTVMFTMRWVIHLLARFPVETRQMQSLIDSVIPHGQQVNFGDKKKLSLIESFVTETIRYSSFATLSFERITNDDVRFEGYVIPRGTLVRAVTHSSQFNAEVFEDPNEFKHDRFLDADNNFQSPKEGMIIFGSGKRACPGEALAKAEVFLFTCALLQRLNIASPAGAALDSTPVDVGGFGFLQPADQPLVYAERRRAD